MFNNWFEIAAKTATKLPADQPAIWPSRLLDELTHWGQCSKCYGGRADSLGCLGWVLTERPPMLPAAGWTVGVRGFSCYMFSKGLSDWSSVTHLWHLSQKQACFPVTEKDVCFSHALGKVVSIPENALCMQWASSAYFVCSPILLISSCWLPPIARLDSLTPLDQSEKGGPGDGDGAEVQKVTHGREWQNSLFGEGDNKNGCRCFRGRKMQYCGGVSMHFLVRTIFPFHIN